MKLRSGRKYKNDLSDIIGILSEHEKLGEPITMESIDTAVTNLYGGWDSISEEARQYIQNVMRQGNYGEMYDTILEEERRTKDLLIEFREHYPGVADTVNVDSIVADLKAKRGSKASILEQVRKKKSQ